MADIDDDRSADSESDYDEGDTTTKKAFTREKGSESVQRAIRDVEELRTEELTFLNLSFEQIGKLTTELARYFAPDYVPTEIGEGFVERQVKHGHKWGEVDISYEKLTAFPESLLLLPRLQKITLVGNEITEIPKGIEVFGELSLLNMNRNQIKTVPSAITKLTKLEDLRLGFNNIETLPDDLYHMTQLKTLYLTQNAISTVPEVLSKMTHVTDLCLAKNPIEQPKKGKGGKASKKKKK